MTTRIKSTPNSRKELIRENHLHPTEYRWFAVWVEPQCEKRAAELLNKKSIHNYLPLQKKKKHYKKRKPHWVETPLIRGYVFVKITQKEYITVLQTSYVKKFLRIKNNLLCIPEKEIILLRRFLGQRDYEINVLKTKEWEVGTPVRIKRGHLLGYQGFLVQKKNRRTFVIQLDTIGHTLELEVPEEDLEPILT